MPKCDFNKVAKQFIEITLRHGHSPVNLLQVFRNLFLRAKLESCFCTTNLCKVLSNLVIWY